MPRLGTLTSFKLAGIGLNTSIDNLNVVYSTDANTSLLLRFDQVAPKLDYSVYRESTTVSGIATTIRDGKFDDNGSMTGNNNDNSSLIISNSTNSLPYIGAHTIEFWIKITQPITGALSLLTYVNATTLSSGINIYAQSDGGIGGTFYNSAGSAFGDELAPSGTLTVGNWVHFAIVINNGSVNYTSYANGVRRTVRTNNLSGYYVNGIPSLRVFPFPTSANKNVMIDELRISNLARYTGTTYSIPSGNFDS
jgi:hypothetical protein